MSTQPIAEQVPIATVALTRDEDGHYAVVVTFADGKVHSVSSVDWRTIGRAMDFASRLIAGELSKRQTLGEVP